MMLQEINAILSDYIQSYVDNSLNTLSDEEKNKISIGLAQLEEGLEVSHNEVLAMISDKSFTVRPSVQTVFSVSI